MMGTSTERERGKKVIANDWGRGGKRSISFGRVPSDVESEIYTRTQKYFVLNRMNVVGFINDMYKCLRIVINLEQTCI